MAIVKAKGQQTTSVARGSEGADVYIKALRDGTLTMADWLAALSIEGRVFCANAGTVTSPITFGAGDITETEYDLHVSVPAGTTIIPISLAINMEAFGSSAIFQIEAAYGTGSTTGAGTSITPANLNTNSNLASGCTVTAAATTTSGAAWTAKKVEFWREGHIISQTPVTCLLSGSAIKTNFEWSAADKGFYPVVVGAAQLGVFAACQAGTGFITLVYAELPSSALT